MAGFAYNILIINSYSSSQSSLNIYHDTGVPNITYASSCINTLWFKAFDYAVCDKCRDMSKDGDHELIPRTEAKNTFLLRDFDFDEREEGKALKFISRKNPHNPGGGAMKLYLRLQVGVVDPDFFWSALESKSGKIK